VKLNEYHEGTGVAAPLIPSLGTVHAGEQVRVRHYSKYLVDGKGITLQAWTGPEVSRRLRIPHFKTVGAQK
jgi:hypothetical protein